MTRPFRSYHALRVVSFGSGNYIPMRPDLGRHLVKIRSDQVVTRNVAGLFEPECRELCQDLALAGDKRGQHAVERRYPICRYEEYSLRVHLIYIADLAAVKEL